MASNGNKYNHKLYFLKGVIFSFKSQNSTNKGKNFVQVTPECVACLTTLSISPSKWMLCVVKWARAEEWTAELWLFSWFPCLKADWTKNAKPVRKF